MEEIRSSGATIIIVSHDLNTISKMADYVYVLDEGKVAFEGHPTNAINHYKGLLRKRELDAMPSALRLETLRVERLKEQAEKSPGTKGRIISCKIGPKNSEGKLKVPKAASDIELELLENVNLPTIGFAINNINGIRIFGGNNKILKISLLETER